MSLASLTINDAKKDFSALETIPKNIADKIRPYFLSMDIEGYKQWLEMMYYYTLGSEPKGKESAENSNSEDLKEFFLHMAKEERGHYILAQKDLEAFGLTIDTSKPEPDVITAYNNWWSKNYDNTLKHLAALYVFENIAEHLAQDVIEKLKEFDLSKKQTRWVFVHAEADDEHGDEVAEIAAKYFSYNKELMLQAAEEAANLWFEINKKPLDK